MKIGEYQTIRANSAADLDKHVNEALEQGFELYGNPYVAESAGQTMICQAMVKEARGKTDRVSVSGT